MLNINKLSKKYNIPVRKAKEYLDKSYSEAKTMGKEKDDFYVEQIFIIMSGFKESSCIPRYKRMFSETIMSSSIPQNVRPEQNNVSKEDEEETEKLKKILKIKNHSSVVK